MIENPMIIDYLWEPTKIYDEAYEQYLNEKADREYEDYIFQEMIGE